MEKGIVIYHSKYGATKKYVNWLIEETNFDYIETSNAKIKDIEKYNIIILCGGIYASSIVGLSFLRKNYNVLKHKKLVIFCVGASPFEEKAFNEIKLHNLKKDLINIPTFYGRGAWDEKNMTFKDRILCKLLEKVISKKDPNTYEPWMKALMSAVGEKCDWTDRKYLKPLLEYIN